MCIYIYIYIYIYISGQRGAQRGNWGAHLRGASAGFPK